MTETEKDLLELIELYRQHKKASDAVIKAQEEQIELLKTKIRLMEGELNGTRI